MNNNQLSTIRTQKEIDQYRAQQRKKAHKQERQVRYDANLISSRFETIAKVFGSVGSILSILTTNRITSKVMGGSNTKSAKTINWLMMLWSIIKSLRKK